MHSMADKNALWEQGEDESVEVNQRALIDKVLARYSGEFTVFRELLQNADDARAGSVEIRFETTQYLKQNKAATVESGIKGAKDKLSQLLKSSKDRNDSNIDVGPSNPADKPFPALKDIIIGQWTIKNDGVIFRDEDWNRLKKIADGNPDEEKIGAFGVGFYSLFSITEEPFVTSGARWMGFHWKDGKDQLYARRGNLPTPDTPDLWTTFTLPLRQPSPLPGAPLDLLRFLSSSIPFMTSLSKVELYLDGALLGRISKAVGSASAVGVPPSFTAVRGDNISSVMGNAGALIKGWADRGMRVPDPTSRKGKEKYVEWNWATPKKYMTLTNITAIPVHIRAEVIRWVDLVGSEKVTPVKKMVPAATATEALAKQTKGFLASLISSFASHRSVKSSRRSRFTFRRDKPAPSTPVHAPEKVDSVEHRKLTASSVMITVFTAEAKVNLDEKMEVELERATKKKAPSTVKIGLIYTGKDEYDASEKEDIQDASGSKDMSSVFMELRADLDGNNSSRVYIGHATGQTTGISGHMSARFIPTVERESIDLVNQHVSVWNTELLHIGGYLSRVVYETEMAEISRLYITALQAPSSSTSGPDSKPITSLQSRCLHALRFFTFRPSTPSPDVSRTMKSAFFAASSSFSILSTSGVRPTSEVHIRSPDMEKFMRNLPILPKEIQDGAADVITLLQDKNMIRQITFDDVIAEMKSRCFEEEEMLECIKWRINLPRQLEFDAHFKGQFIGAGVFRAGRNKDGPGSTEGDKIITLSGISTYFNPKSLVPPDGPFPSTSLPLKLSIIIKGVSPNTYEELFGWTAFSINDWIVYLSSKPPAEVPDAEHDITKSPLFAEKVLITVAKSWPSLSKPNRVDIVQRLSAIPFIPTQLGLKLPADSYFFVARVFSDLPVVTPSLALGARSGKLKMPMEELLAALGVHKHVNLQLVFNRMIKTGDWTVPQLVKYLSGVRDTLTTEEILELKGTVAFAKEEQPTHDVTNQDNSVSVAASDAEFTPRKQRFKIGDLYEPNDALRQLGLPILDWGSNPRWRAYSDEARFLFSLGLQRYPSLVDLLKKASGRDKDLREFALKYFFDKFSSQYSFYQPEAFTDLAFIPALKADGTEFLAKAGQVFSQPGGAVMGFAIIRSDIKDEAKAKLKIPRHPSAAIVTEVLLSNPPTTEEQARKVFEYLTNLLGEFPSDNLDQLRMSNIIPAQTPRSTGFTMIKPAECYFKCDNGQSHFHSNLFTFIDFGRRANNFLAACGVRNAPTADDVARTLIADPDGFYSLAGGAEGFKKELRQIAASLTEITTYTKQVMMRSPILLGSRVAEEEEESQIKRKKASVGAEDEDEVVYELLRPDQIVIIDDVNSHAQFREMLYGAPQEDDLEALYASLGSPRLSHIIKEDYKPVGERMGDPDAVSVRKLVLERLPLFLHGKKQSRLNIRPEWMQDSSNFVVKKVARLILQKTLVWEGKQTIKDCEASAASKREGVGRTLILYIGDNMQRDFYDVANSLCKQILRTPRVNDSWAFSSILSTDLPTLKQRGYNVDRILNQQKVEREARESARRAAQRMAGGPRWGTLKGHDANARPTPESEINKIVEEAIQACRPEARNLLQNRQQIETIKEVLDEGYCDVSGIERDLVLVGNVTNMRIYAEKGIPKAQELLLRTKEDPIRRFISIIQPLKRVYKLPDASIHIFYNLEGPLIAFNAGGALFLNLRYFEGWHDAQVKAREPVNAIISWFFMLAHEIAHNLVGPHNAEHSYYMNRISSVHLLRLIDELQKAELKPAPALKQSAPHVDPAPLQPPMPRAQTASTRVKYDIISKLKYTLQKEGDTWYVVSATWINQWWRIWAPTPYEGDDSSLGPIDNSDIVDEQGFLLPMLSEGLECEIICKEAWNHFVEWYGPPTHIIARKVISEGLYGRKRVEIYPLKLFIFRMSKMTPTSSAGMTLAIEISKSATVQDLLEEVAQISTSDPVNLRYWLVEGTKLDEKPLSGTFYPSDRIQEDNAQPFPQEESDRTKSLDEALVKSQDAIVYEYRAGGAWTVDPPSIYIPRANRTAPRNYTDL